LPDVRHRPGHGPELTDKLQTVIEGILEVTMKLINLVISLPLCHRRSDVSI
jgi:hypothetical protein